SLREADDTLRIDLRLIETPSGRTLWAQGYDRKLADVFAIQSEVAQAVAGALALRLGLATKAEGDVDVAQYREYLGLRSILLKPEFTSGTPKQNAAREALRALIVRAPGYARAHGLLARSLSAQVTPSFNPSAAQLDDAAREAALALKLDADNSDAHATLAELACRRTDWETCIEEYRRALALDPADVATRGRYALRLSGIGYVDAALREFDTAHRSDPLETTVSWQRARILDTLGRHDEAKDAEESGIKQGVIPQQPAAYSRWHNAVWRHDYAQAREVAAQMPEQDGFREAYMAVTQALQDVTLWPQALTAIGESERRTGHYNFARLLGPGYDARAVFASFEPMLRDGFPSYSLLVWQAEYAALRRDPAFQDYIRRNHILDYWRTHDFPPQCQPDGDGARCGDPGSATSAAAATALAPVTASGKSPTLVVLPLRQAGKQHDEAVLAEGVSEELTTRLARVDGLNLISSTSAALAQERKLDPEQLAEQLRVDHVLEGSLRDKGDSLHVELRLAEVPGGKTLWTQDYDRPLAKLPALEGEIAQAVASALALRPVATDRADAASVDPALLRRVIEARSVLRNPGAHPGQSAEAMARAVLEEHPDYGPALGQHALILELQFKSPEDDAVGRREAERAIQLDPNDTEARVALAYAAAHEADWEQALAMYRTALQLAPADSVYRAGYGTMLAGLGYLDEGMRQSDIGVAYDPLGFVATSRRAEMLDTLGRHDEAKRQLDATLASTPGANPAYRRWLNAAWRHDAAGLQAALAAMPDKNAWKDSYRIATAALFDARLWPQTHAAIEESEQRARAQGDAGGFNFLRLMEPQPDYVKTFAGLGAGLRRNFPYYFLMVWMPEYRAARQSPPFQDFIKRNHVLDYWRAHGFPPQCRPDGDGAKCD
ncbi:hypothetical protein, partial [Rudaea sp.]|uniref:hypothetical protein n=1 Tax=Rudaea sp. TaxID=2136325 RepID=UPI0032208888